VAPTVKVTNDSKKFTGKYISIYFILFPFVFLCRVLYFLFLIDFLMYFLFGMDFLMYFLFGMDFLMCCVLSQLKKRSYVTHIFLGICMVLRVP